MARPQRLLLRRLAGAVALGVGAIFQARPEHHWSESPTVIVEEAPGAESSGDPPDPVPPAISAGRRRRGSTRS